MSVERPMVTLVAVAVKNVMGLEEKMIRLMREIRLYRYPGERNSRHKLERRKRKMLWSVSQLWYLYRR